MSCLSSAAACCQAQLVECLSELKGTCRGLELYSSGSYDEAEGLSPEELSHEASGLSGLKHKSRIPHTSLVNAVITFCSCILLTAIACRGLDPGAVQQRQL